MNHLDHLHKDKKISKIILLQAPFVLCKRNHVHLHLCASILSQQLSTKVAEIIYQRFLALFETNTPTVEEILDVPFEKLRGIGMSNSKTQYIRNVCEFFLAQKLTDAKLHKMTSEEVMEKLVQIKGVGRWTVEMLLMFTLGYEDVFAVDDLGIQQAMTKLYMLDATDKKKMQMDMLRISKKWSPYRTYACRYLWGWKDSVK